VALFGALLLLREATAVGGRALSEVIVMLCYMKYVSVEIDRAVLKVLRQQGDLITRTQILAAGWTEAALRYRTRVGGSWGTVLPGVYTNHTGPLTAVQREIAAVLYAGSQCVITGESALRQHGVPVAATDVVDVLVPHSMSRRSTGFVRLHRTSRIPDQPWVSDGMRWASVARAVADTARTKRELRDVTALVAMAVQRRKCTIQQLATELKAGPCRGSALLKAALEEVADGVASAAEADLRKLIKVNKLPEPLYNARLYVGAEFLAEPDAWWRDAGVAGEVDSREWHLSPADWARTMERHARMSAQGIIVLHFTPARIRSDGTRIAAELRAAIEAGRERAPLAIRAVPSR
jgi:hypothetical protein